jgi:hypothetical protein
LKQAANAFDAPAVGDKQAMAALKHEGFQPGLRVKIDGNMRTIWIRDPSGLIGQLSHDKLREKHRAEAGTLKAGAA